VRALRELGCRRTLGRLPLFVGGDLDDRVARAVSAHLRSCQSCRREASAQLQAKNALADAVAATVVPGVDEALFVELHQRVLERVATAAPTAPRQWGRRAAIAVAAGTLFGLGWLAARPDGGLLGRTPIHAAGAAHRGSDSFAGPTLQPLGHDVMWRFVRHAEASDSSGLGLMGRLMLRTLEDEEPAMAGDLFDEPSVSPAGPPAVPPSVAPAPAAPSSAAPPRHQTTRR
jgi:hypothetical protein